MSDFKFHCPHCRQRFQCDEQLAGRRILCPVCRRQIIVASSERGSRPETKAGNGSLNGGRFNKPPPASDA